MSTIQQKMFEELREKKIFDKAIDYGYAYLDHALKRNVFPTDEAISNLKNFEEEMPLRSSNASDVIDFLNQFGAPATVSQIGGRYFGFVNGSVVPTGMAAKSLATFWDQNTAMYVLSPLASKLESIVEGWLRSVFNLPRETVAGFVSGTSSANFCALAAARYRLFKNQNWDINKKGFVNAPPIRVVTGKEAHSTVIKAITLLGFGHGNIEFIETDEQGRICPELIPELDNKTLLILQAGNVNTGSFDAFSKICDKAKKAGAWMHIDGAFGLWAGACEKLSHLTNGIEQANSWAVDGHKTLNTPYDCGIVMCSDKEALTGALHMSGGYIVVSEFRDGMYYTPEMSRRARVIELWATLKYLGREGIDQMIFEMHERAKQFANEISATDGFTVLNDVVFNQLLVRCATDEITNKVIEHVQNERVCWVGGSTWQGKRVIRISVCSWATTADDISKSAQSFKSALAKTK